MAPHEVLELILYYVIPRRDTNSIAHGLIKKYGSLRGVLTAPVESLSAEPYITYSGAVLLNMFGKKGDFASLLEEEKPRLGSLSEVVDFMRAVLADKPKEEIIVLCLDGRDRLIRQVVSKGTVNSASTYNREILQEVLNSHAMSVIIGHNHPAGDVAPSSSDVKATARIKSVLDGVGIKLYDHVIIAGDSYYSFARQGMLEEASASTLSVPFFVAEGGDENGGSSESETEQGE